MAVERKDFLVKQAAAEISMSVQWLYQMIKDGKGPEHRRRGRLILIKPADLQRWDKQRVIR